MAVCVVVALLLMVFADADMTLLWASVAGQRPGDLRGRGLAQGLLPTDKLLTASIRL